MRDYEEIIRWIDYRKEAMTKQLEEWVNIHSGSDNPIGLDIMFNTLYKAFSILDAEMQTVYLEDSDISRSLEGAVHTPRKALIVTKRKEAPLQILFGGHMDTVYPLTQHPQRAKYIESDKLKGPGTIDMKGGLVIMLRSLEAFEQYEFCKEIGWQVLITPDEEIGSPLSKPLHLELSKNHHLGFIFEPTFPDGSFVSSRKGSMNFTILSKGIQAHVGRDFHSGKNAITSLIKLLIKIEKYNSSSNITFNLGKIEGGGPSNIVPDLALAKCNIRMMNREEMDEIREKITFLIEEENDEGSNLTWFEESVRPPKNFNENEKKLFSIFEKTAKQLNLPFKIKESGGVCDGNFWATSGLPTIDTLGATGVGMHTEEECIFLESLLTQTKLCTSVMMNLASKKIERPNFSQDRTKLRI